MGTTGAPSKKGTLDIRCSPASDSVQMSRAEERRRKEQGKPGLDPSLPPASRAVEPKASPSQSSFHSPQSGAWDERFPRACL